jgi:nucleoside 2-deoxyribosyltransferase
MVALKLQNRKSKQPAKGGTKAGLFLGKTICFCGSFKFYKDMEEAAAYLRKVGLEVVVPKPSHIRHGHKPEELKSCKYDKETLKKWEKEGAFFHLSNIRRSDAVYIFNQGSYLGPAVTVEIGFALALGKPIFAKAPVEDITVTNFIKAVVPPHRLPKLLRSTREL